MFRRSTTPEVRRELCRSVAQQALDEFQKRNGNPGLPIPPIPIEEVARQAGYEVVLLSSVPDEFSALVSTRDKLIGVNGKHHPHRQRFSIGHELGHILMKHPPESHCAAYEIRLYNAEADICASELLIPGTILKKWLAKTQNSKELARIFNVSPEAMARKIARVEKPQKQTNFATVT